MSVWVKVGQRQGGFLDEHPEMSDEIEKKVYDALNLSRDLVKPIEHEEPPLAAVDDTHTQAA